MISQNFIADLDMFSSSGDGHRDRGGRKLKRNRKEKKETKDGGCDVAPDMDGTAMLERCRNTWKMAHKNLAQERRRLDIFAETPTTVDFSANHHSFAS